MQHLYLDLRLRRDLFGMVKNVTLSLKGESWPTNRGEKERSRIESPGYLDLLVEDADGKKWPQKYGRAKWWFRMVQSIKKSHQSKYKSKLILYNIQAHTVHGSNPKQPPGM